MIIAGAGAALEFGAPSTADLTAHLRQAVHSHEALPLFGSDKAFANIADTLADYLDGRRDAVNFEQIFHCAQEILAHTFKPTPGAVDEFKPLLYPFLGRCRVLNEKAALTELVRAIPNLLFSRLSDASDQPTTPLAPLEHFLRRLQETHITRIYTTNYDDFILQAVSDLYHGFDETPGSGPRSFQPETFWASTDKDGIFHLHGSVHFGFPPPPRATFDLNVLRWFHCRTEARSHSTYNGGPEFRMDGSFYMPSALVTGFDKLTRLQQTPQAHYYASLASDAMTADLIILIGFSLLDLHISARLAEARRRRPRPRLVFVDFWEHGFSLHPPDHSRRKEIEMFHALEMFTVDRERRQNTTKCPPAWTVAGDRSWAVWDNGFLSFLNTPDQLPNILSGLAPV